MTLSPTPLPTFPWDTLARAHETAAAHPGGIIDLSIGTPVDSVPMIARKALEAASDAPGYPPVVGSADLREAIAGWVRRRRGAGELTPAGVLPTVGSKEAVASLPAQLGVPAGGRVLFPDVAYPTYDVGARLAGAEPVAVGSDPREWPAADLVWLNSPGNPDGHVLSVEELRRIREWARRAGAVVVSDECYAELSWEGRYAIDEEGRCPNTDARGLGAPSLLDDAVTDGDHEGLLVVYSASKQSNLAGYRASFVYGDSGLIARLTLVRKHAGLMMPAPTQAALTQVLNDDVHVAQQRERYRARRNNLLAGASVGGLANDPDSVAGLYLWLGHEDADNDWELVDALARLGILVAPASFYGERVRDRVRMSLTASDEQIAEAAQRLAHFSLTRAR